ncbi:MAG: hypothetical protein BAJALOKI1v1_2560003 [Promethearchaeota archaeon]|nr:MAG: hypothetical protein BAJALOKI1v1_2560003 [Candidatus Lokiarchaeota archaeon]
MRKMSDKMRRRNYNIDLKGKPICHLCKKPIYLGILERGDPLLIIEEGYLWHVCEDCHLKKEREKGVNYEM